MADKRELILARILAICGAVEGVKSVRRNEIGVPRGDQPGIVLLDGDEEVYRTLGRPNTHLPPQIMRLRFGLFIQVKDMKPAEANGTLLNTIRVATIKALVEDTGLRTLIGTNGAVEYRGAITDLKAGAALSGEMNLEFTCNYLFNPTDG